MDPSIKSDLEFDCIKKLRLTEMRDFSQTSMHFETVFNLLIYAGTLPTILFHSPHRPRDFLWPLLTALQRI